MADIPLSVLENMSKKDMESFILYLRERPLLNANTTKKRSFTDNYQSNLVSTFQSL